jgi:biopolymer transport protein ExbD
VLYQDVVTVMDVATKVGFTAVLVDDGAAATDASASAPPSTARGAVDLKSAPVIVIAKTEIRVNATRVTATKPAAIAAEVTAALRAIAKTSGAAGGSVIVQADVATPSSVLLAAIRGARAAGYSDVLFAVQRR